MYPELLNSQSEEVRNTAKAYIDEMGTISETFMAYKEVFNTRSKISASPDSFASESDRGIQRYRKENRQGRASLHKFLRG